MRTKDFTAKVKAAGVADGLAEGQFVALVSVFGNEDSVGDVVRPGAFTESLAEWSAKGDPIPVIWSHAWGDPFAHIGTVLKAVETLQGLEVIGQIDDLDTNPTSAQVYRLLKGRRVTQFSFAYDVKEGAWVDDDQHQWGGYYELRRLKLHEVGPCLVGANQETELLAAKADGLARGAKAGRVLSQANYDSLARAHEAIGEVLAAATPEMSKTPEKSAEEPEAQGPETAAGITPPAQSTEVPHSPAATAEPAPSSTEEEPTPDLREASVEDAAKVGAAASRLLTRLDLDLIEIGA
ncbi:HK97 family phage prohead protease [Streptomyces xanthochromogenes]|uniref:HK97 family phage prohead protease n=1 Tax=Streptomyces xanthochromogenes TaxID=67384 RepID=UPI002F41D424